MGRIVSRYQFRSAGFLASGLRFCLSSLSAFAGDLLTLFCSQNFCPSLTAKPRELGNRQRFLCHMRSVSQKQLASKLIWEYASLSCGKHSGLSKCDQHSPSPDQRNHPRFPVAETNLIALLFQGQSPRRKTRITSHSRSRSRTLPDGREILAGYRYELRRRQVLQRDGFCCVSCGSPYYVEVHHRHKRSLGRDDRASNLISLCASCHSKEHQE
jgi:5-methylcytosine-specific restriction endonuclease McrA